MENDIAVVPEVRYDLAIARAPKQVLAEAQDAAKALQSVIGKSTVKFNGKQYLTFEHWQTCGRFYGVTAKIVSTEYVEIADAKGFVARAEAINTQTGAIISAAESMCMNDEATWGKKPLFQLRSMAQTRAAAKSLRNCLAWVVILAGYEPSVAEEMTGEETSHAPAKEPIKPPTAKADPFKVTFVPSEVDEKEGEKDGKSWRKFGVKLPDGSFAGTFNEEIGYALLSARDEKKSVTLTWKADGKYKTIISI